MGCTSCTCAVFPGWLVVLVAKGVTAPGSSGASRRCRSGWRTVSRPAAAARSAAAAGVAASRRRLAAGCGSRPIASRAMLGSDGKLYAAAHGRGILSASYEDTVAM